MKATRHPHATTRQGVRILPTDEALSFHGHDAPVERMDGVEAGRTDTGAVDTAADSTEPVGSTAGTDASIEHLRWHPSLGPGPSSRGQTRHAVASWDDGPTAC